MGVKTSYRLFYSRLETVIYLRSPGSYCGEWYLETQISELSEFIASRVSLLLHSLRSQSYLNVHTHTQKYSHTYTLTHTSMSLFIY